MPAIPVIVPVYNRPEYTKACLDTLYRAEYHGAPVWPVIVDNGSRLKTSQLIADWKRTWGQQAEDVKKDVAEPVICRRPSNEGFAAAVNAGLAIVKETLPSSPSVCVMHNDCIPFPGWMGEMSACLAESDVDVAIIVPRTDYANEGSPCVVSYKVAFQNVKPSNKERITAEEVVALVDRLYPDRPGTVKAVAEDSAVRMSYTPEISCFCMLLKAEAAFGYPKFDPDFWPRGWEDKFWFRNLERDGLVCCIANRAFVHHNGNTTSDGPGFCFPDIMKVNGEKYRAKCEEEIRNSPLDAKEPKIENPCQGKDGQV